MLVGGKIAVSRGILKYWTDATQDRALGRQRLLLKCETGHFYIKDDRDAHCPECEGRPEKVQRLLFPRFGYLTAAWEPMRWGVRPERIGEVQVYPTDEKFLTASPTDGKEDFGGLQGLQARYYEDTELLLRNGGQDRQGFAVCTRCGFAMSERDHGEGRDNLPSDFANHARLFQTKERPPCWKKGEAPVLRNHVLAALERTDLILFHFPQGSPASEEAIVSLGRALVLAAARMLEIDGRELDARPKLSSPGRFDLIIYDATSSGAGHCFELLDAGDEWFAGAHHILHGSGSEEHDRRCVRACLDCILDFTGQFAGAKLNRQAALNLLGMNQV